MFLLLFPEIHEEVSSSVSIDGFLDVDMDNVAVPSYADQRNAPQRYIRLGVSWNILHLPLTVLIVCA